MQALRLSMSPQGLTAACLRLIQSTRTILLFCLVIEVALNCFYTIGTFDFPWQLAEGEFILNHGHPAHSVLKAYGEVSPHFANEYIPYEVLIAGINRIAGWCGLCLFFALLTFLI